MIRSFRAARRLLPAGSTPRRGLFLALCAAVLAIAAVFGVVVMDARSDAQRAAVLAGSNLATVLAQDIDRNVELLDLSLQAARDAWSSPRVRALDPELRQLVIFDRSTSARYIDAVLVVDRSGAVVADSHSAVPRPGDYREADFFEAQARRDMGVFIGCPMRAADGTGWRVALSRRIADDEGGFAGVVVGFIDLGYLSEVYRHLPLGPGGILTLFNVDGTMLVHEPAVPNSVGRSFKGRRVFDTIAASGSGAFEGVSALDGQSRLFAFHRVGKLPLIQAVAASTNEIYAGWRTKAVALGAVLAVLCSVILILLFVLKRELQQRMAAETALAVLASTDHLTGLPNRRRFFEHAGLLCAAAAQDRRSLSVMMIDVDHFKSYNDRYGHVAGDAVLAAIGRAIAGELRRVTGLAARYGGEEFIVLLAGFDRERTFLTAEAIRTAVTALARPHERATAGIVTISIGLACAGPGHLPDLRTLVEAADAELYRSKQEGRNRSGGGLGLMARLPGPEAKSA